MAVKSLFSVAVAVLIGVAGCSSPSENAGGQDSPSASASESATAEPTEPTESASPASPEETPEKTPEKTAEKTPDDAPEAEPVVITITDFEFDGPESVAPGSTIMVENTDRSSHTVTSEDDSFVEVIVEGGGDTGTFKAPSEPGEYAYICRFHPEMSGTLVVA